MYKDKKVFRDPHKTRFVFFLILNIKLTDNESRKFSSVSNHIQHDKHYIVCSVRARWITKPNVCGPSRCILLCIPKLLLCSCNYDRWDAENISFTYVLFGIDKNLIFIIYIIKSYIKKFSNNDFQ